MPIALNDAAREPWSEIDLVDLQSGVAFGAPVKEIADFLVRDVEEVRQKIAALKLECGVRPTAQPLAR